MTMWKQALMLVVCGAALVGCSEKSGTPEEAPLPPATGVPSPEPTPEEAPRKSAPAAPEASAPAMKEPVAPKPIPKPSDLKVGMSRGALMEVAEHCLSRINLVPAGAGRTAVETFEALEGECRESLGRKRLRVVGGTVHSIYETDPTLLTKPPLPPELEPLPTKG